MTTPGLPRFGSITPMLAAVALEVPDGDNWLYEPKWDGFRAIVFRIDGMAHIQSREGKTLDRYFPEVIDALVRCLPDGCVLDGEIVIAGPGGLDFDALQQRIHPSASRVERLMRETPSSFVAFDLIALDGATLCALPQDERRLLLQALLADVPPPIYLTPMTTSHATALEWLKAFEGAGLDGVVAKQGDGPYLPGQRAMLKIKHARTADCVVAGFRWHKSGDNAIGSLLLGLYDNTDVLQHVGSASAFSMPIRRALAKELEPLQPRTLAAHPWAAWGNPDSHDVQRMPGAQSRWSSGKDLGWQPLRIERVCEVRYDHLQGRRFRHAAIFLRWRPDKPPKDCRFDQLEVVAPYALSRVFSGKR
ncbi:MAG: ATP-dependent DNA ligase [Variovorax sp.]|nr:ATP-dependent DNA ligase [Variovorax sp.]